MCCGPHHYPTDPGFRRCDASGQSDPNGYHVHVHLPEANGNLATVCITSDYTGRDMDAFYASRATYATWRHWTPDGRAVPYHDEPEVRYTDKPPHYRFTDGRFATQEDYDRYVNAIGAHVIDLPDGATVLDALTLALDGAAGHAEQIDLATWRTQNAFIVAGGYRANIAAVLA